MATIYFTEHSFLFICFYNTTFMDVITFSGELKGKKLLDIGTGPIVYNIITPSKWFDEIYLSDVAKTNVDFLQRWRRGNSEPMKRVMERFAKKEQ